MLSESSQTLPGRTPHEPLFEHNPVNPLDPSGPGHGGARSLRTTDGGSSWSDVSPETGVDNRAVFLLDAQTAWVIRASKRAAQPGQANMGIPIWIHTTSDGGRSWTSRMMPLPSEAYPVESEYEGTYLGGAGNCDFHSPAYASTAIWKAALTCESKSWLYSSANQGKTWIISPMPAGQWEYVDIQFINPTVGWLFVTNWDDRQGPLYQTSDGGQTLEPQLMP